MARLHQMLHCRAASWALHALLFFSMASIAEPAAGVAGSPVVTPATGGGGVPLINGGVVDVDAIGYDTAEFLLSGDAHSYTTAAPLTSDGKWDAISADPTTAAFRPLRCGAG